MEIMSWASFPNLSLALKGGAANVLCTWTAAQRDLSPCVFYSLPPRRCKPAARKCSQKQRIDLLCKSSGNGLGEFAFSGVFSLSWRTYLWECGSLGIEYIVCRKQYVLSSMQPVVGSCKSYTIYRDWTWNLSLFPSSFLHLADGISWTARWLSKRLVSNRCTTISVLMASKISWAWNQLTS